MMKSRRDAHLCTALPFGVAVSNGHGLDLGVLVSNLFQDSQSEEMLKW